LSRRDAFHLRVAAPDPQPLADQIAPVAGEYLALADEMHLTYNAIQTDWQHDLGRAGWLGRPAHTQLFFEYTALVVLRCARDSSAA
jgi:hypothetical protein